MKSERNYGIDLLRIVSMLMVTILHVLGQGGVLKNAELLSTQWSAAWFLETAAYCAVNCYALISGYVGINSKFKYSGIAYLWLQVVFYTVTITTIFVAIHEKVVKQDIVPALFPVSEKYYWYFTAYFAAFFFIPIINKGINALTKKQLYACGVAIVVLFSVLPIWQDTDLFYENKGYSAIWLMLLYILGAIMKKCEIEKKIKTVVALLLYLSAVVVSWLQLHIVEYHNLMNPEAVKWKTTLISYISPTILLAGIMLVVVFSKMKTGKFVQKIIMIFAPLSFGVYIIHVHKYVWAYIMKNRFVEYASLNTVELIAVVLGTGLAIYLVCTGIDFLRDRLFKLLRIREMLTKLETRFLKDFWQ